MTKTWPRPTPVPSTRPRHQQEVTSAGRRKVNRTRRPRLGSSRWRSPTLWSAWPPNPNTPGTWRSRWRWSCTPYSRTVWWKWCHVSSSYWASDLCRDQSEPGCKLVTAANVPCKAWAWKWKIWSELFSLRTRATKACGCVKIRPTGLVVFRYRETIHVTGMRHVTWVHRARFWRMRRAVRCWCYIPNTCTLKEVNLQFGSNFFALSQCFPTFLGLQRSTEGHYNLCRWVANP